MPPVPPQNPDIKPPIADKHPYQLELFGDIRIDDYYWLREKKNPDVIGYLNEENQYTGQMMRHTDTFQKQLYDEMLGRIKETDLSVPEKIDDYYYYTRTEKGKQYPIYCRKKGALEAAEEIILDVNELAEGYTYLKIGVAEISPDHSLLAYSVDTDGSESFTLYIKNTANGKLIGTPIPDTHYSVEWANDNRTIFYTVLDETKRPHRVYRHTIDTDPKGDELVYQETDQSYFVWLHKTRSKKYIMISCDNITTSEVRYLDADKPRDLSTVFQNRQKGIEYSLNHHEDTFYIVTNEDAKNFKLMAAPVRTPDKVHWSEVIPHRTDIKLDGIDIFSDYMVIYERTNGLKSIRIRDIRVNVIHTIEFPEPVYNIVAADNPEYKTEYLRFHYTSFVTPMSVFDYNMRTRERELKKQTEVLGGYNPDEYISEQLFATATDGTRIPLSLVHKKGMRRDGDNPAVLYGYGAYGISQDVNFSSHRISLLDRGFVVGIAHIRGGGEMGRQWYEDGKLLNKKNTFTDFIECAEYIIENKYTSPRKLVIYGGSAGGLLVGAVLNMRPDICSGAIANVPFLDVLTTMLDSSLPLTVTEYDEWGNPNDKVYYDYIKSYSPYDNVTAQDYPHILARAGLNDPRVQYWEPAKWTAKLRATKTDSNLLLLKTDMGTGHGGASGRYDFLKDLAFEYAFIVHICDKPDHGQYDKVLE
jgi:oligopeptidase B